jgi:hypothetical protein
MWKILFILILVSPFFAIAADTIQIVQPGTAITVKSPSVLLTQTQFQTVVSKEQQLKADSMILIEQQKIISNGAAKDSLLSANAALQDSITQKYKSLYEASAKQEAKLSAVPWYKSGVIWFILGGALFYFATAAEAQIK